MKRGASAALAVTVGALLSAAVPVLSQEQAASPAPCSTPEHRQFDFWVGEWEVRDSTGNLLGTTTISKELGGCALRDGNMVLTGQTVAGDGATTLNRITWQQIAGGRVGQLWESSADDGATRRVLFDGIRRSMESMSGRTAYAQRSSAASIRSRLASLPTT